MNIKSDEAHEFARTLAAATGESLTEAVTTAVRERLGRIRQRDGDAPARAQALLDIGRATAPALADVLELSELLYDERGLPR